MVFQVHQLLSKWKEMVMMRKMTAVDSQMTTLIQGSIPKGHGHEALSISLATKLPKACICKTSDTV